jgi:hypothetical protein
MKKGNPGFDNSSSDMDEIEGHQLQSFLTIPTSHLWAPLEFAFE